MGARNTFFVTLGALVMVALVVWFRAASARRDAETGVAALIAQRAELAAQIQKAQQLTAIADRARADAERELNAMPRSSSAKPTAPPPGETVSPPKSQRELIATDPKLEALSLKWSRAVVMLEYGPLFRALKLTPEQMKIFEDNLVKINERSMDLSSKIFICSGVSLKI